jgi:stage V sporulation protein G
MKVTDVRIRKVDRGTALKGVATVTFDEMFAVHDIKIIKGEKGMFIAMPSRKTEEGIYIDIAHPINSDAREYITNEILKAFEE